MADHDAEYDAAVARTEQRRREEPFAVSARYDRRIARIMVRLNTGIEIALTPHALQGLERTKPVDIAEIEISPSGLGLHFPRIDVDLYLPALLEGVFGSRKWMAARTSATAETPRLTPPLTAASAPPIGPVSAASPPPRRTAG